MSFYIFVMQNFGFSGQEVGLTYEAACRLFEYFLINSEMGDQAMLTMFIYMLKICEPKILLMDKMETF